MRRSHSTRGFSLIELMVVIAIIGVLSGIVAVNVTDQQGKANRIKVKADFRTLQDAIDLYRMDAGRLPDTLTDLVRNVSSDPDWDGPYLRRRRTVPRDPWGERYIYERTPEDYVLKSLGADGTEGGTGPDADLIDLKMQEEAGL